MEKQDITLVMICKNEEKGLEKAILSARDFCKQIIIAVDSKSTDKTLEIARKYTDSVLILQWLDNFALARNWVTSFVRTEWCLMLDGHEYVSENIGLPSALKLPVDGILTAIEMENGMIFHYPRIFKSNVQFEGQVHERPQCSKVQKVDGIKIKHNRFEGQDSTAAAQRAAQRDEMVPRVMGEQIKKDKTNIRASFHLGMHYLGRKKFSKAIKYFRLYLKYSKFETERWFVYFQMAQIYLEVNSPFRAFWCAEMADRETPGRWEIQKLEGLIYLFKKKYSKAIEKFVGSFSENVVPSAYYPYKQNDGTTWNFIGECFYHLRQYDKACMAFEKASEQTTEKEVKQFFKKRARLMEKLTQKL